MLLPPTPERASHLPTPRGPLLPVGDDAQQFLRTTPEFGSLRVFLSLSKLLDGPTAEFISARIVLLRCSVELRRQLLARSSSFGIASPGGPPPPNL
jgi:hypothetical protein